jgi:hypothetical protein
MQAPLDYINRHAHFGVRITLVILKLYFLSYYKNEFEYSADGIINIDICRLLI